MNTEITKLKKLGKNIKKYRKLIGLTQNGLAEKADSSREYISRLETGRSIPSLPYLFKLAEALEVSEKDLFDFE